MDIEPFHQIKDKKTEPIVALTLNTIRHSDKWGEKRFEWSEPRKPSFTFAYYVGIVTDDTHVVIEVVKDSSEVLYNMLASGEHGFHRVEWNLVLGQGEEIADDNPEKNYLGKGKYTVTYRHGEASDSMELIVK